jgi:hypothetical protein
MNRHHDRTAKLLAGSRHVASRRRDPRWVSVPGAAARPRTVPASAPVVQHRGVDIPAPNLPAIFGSTDPGLLHPQDGHAGLGGQPLGQVPRMGQVRLPVGVIDQPDVHLPHLPNRAAAPQPQVQPVRVGRVGVPVAGVIEEPDLTHPRVPGQQGTSPSHRLGVKPAAYHGEIEVPPHHQPQCGTADRHDRTEGGQALVQPKVLLDGRGLGLQLVLSAEQFVDLHDRITPGGQELRRSRATTTTRTTNPTITNDRSRTLPRPWEGSRAFGLPSAPTS